MNFEKIVTPLIIAVFFLSIYQAYNIYAENDATKDISHKAGTEGTVFIPVPEVTPLLTGSEGSQPLVAAESTALPPIDLTALIILKEGTFLIPLPPDRRREITGPEKCRSCHENSYTEWSKTIHAKWASSFYTYEKSKKARIDCESCHGPGSLHVKNPRERLFITTFGPASKDTRQEQNTVCINCHNKGNLYYWDNGMHGRTISCTECHQVMKNGTERNLLRRASTNEICFKCHAQKKSQTIHSPHLSQDEAKISCSTCHSPHGSDTPGLLRASSVNENCYSCHADKRGPYLFDHLPVQENCLLCHDPHSSMNKWLLKMRQPFLCLECHSNLPNNLPGNIDAHDVLNPKSRFTYNRGCTNCHPMIHGSRHPSGAGLQR